jgi:hypothetical protein
MKYAFLAFAGAYALIGVTDTDAGILIRFLAAGVLATIHAISPDTGLALISWHL